MKYVIISLFLFISVAEAETEPVSVVSEEDSGWFREAPVWNMYWRNLRWLHEDRVISSAEKSAWENNDDKTGLGFLNRYAGVKHPVDSRGAFCALRDALDASDFSRFTEKKFGTKGPSDRKLRKRVKKIQKTFARYGALNGDMDAFTTSTNNTMRAKALNDVGWKIAAGNYQKFLYQLDANETSQGYWRQGSKDQPYGRYARGFDLKTGKTAMYFDLDDNFYVPRDKERKQTVELRVVYLDKGASRWELNYFCGMGQKERTGLRFTCKDSGEWKEVSRKVTSAVFNNKLSRKADLVLKHVRGEDNTLFHMVEIKR